MNRTPMASLVQVSAWLAKHRNRLKPSRWYYFTHENGYATLVGYRRNLDDFEWDDRRRGLLIFTQHPDRISVADVKVLQRLTTFTTTRGRPWLVDVVYNHFPRKQGALFGALYSTHMGKVYRYYRNQPPREESWSPPVHLRGRR